MKKLIFLFLLAVYFITGTSFLSPSLKPDLKRVDNDEAVNPADTFPVPPANNKMAFYVQRTHNTNTIIYDVNYNSDSTLNGAEPIHAYWLRYADGGGVKELSYIQKNYAYGLNCVCIDKEKQTYKVNFVSYKKRDIYLVKSKSGRVYHACLTINNKTAYLTRVFVKIEGGTFWVPHITYVEVSGRDITTGKPVVEKIIP